MNAAIFIIYGLLAGWTIFSAYYIFYRLRILGLNRIILYVYDSIPNVFTTLGVLGTFVGIYFGLQKFDVNDITNSIPTLLEGLKTAFTTSIWGISLSIIFGKISQIFLSRAEEKAPPKPTDELSALNKIGEHFQDFRDESNRSSEQLKSALIGEHNDSLATHLVKLRNSNSESLKLIEAQKDQLTAIHTSLGGYGEISLLTQIQKLRAEQNSNANETRKNVDFIVESMNKNNVLIAKKFDEFSELLAKNNTEALVEVMKNATEQFNAQMSALIEKLVQENFQELNNSVQRMNTWQQENKQMITQLTSQFKSVANDFQISANSIEDITNNTSKLTNENSHLTRLIEQLQKVMIEDTKYVEIVSKLTQTIDTLKENTDAFEDTTNKLNNWVRNQMNFSDSVAKLLTRLEEIDRIKDINEVFWNNTQRQLNSGVAIIEKASKTLSNDIENINEEFYERLNNTLQNLDTLIQRIIAKYN
jgi:hypothetical protein